MNNEYVVLLPDTLNSLGRLVIVFKVVIQRKEKQMTPAVEDMKKGTCGCGRSPTGKCVGWHGLTEEMYQHQKMLWMEDQLRKDNEAEQNSDAK